MEELHRQVRRAQWWLGVQRFLKALGWCWFAALLAALVLIALDKYRPLGVEAWGWGAGALGIGFLAAVVWAIVTGRGPVDAAIEIDRRFGLKERLSSTLTLNEEQRQTEIGRALIDDAARQVSRIEVAEQFRASPGRQIFLPLLPGIAAVLVALLIPAAGDKTAEARTDNEAVKKQIDKTSQSLQIKLAEKIERAKKQNLKDAQKLFLRLEQELGEAAKTVGDKKEALAKLHDLAEQLAKRRQELGGNDAIEKQLEQLKNLGQGPADKFLQSLAKGDVKAAMKELEKIKLDLANGKLDDKQRKALADQLNQMQKKLQGLGEAHRKTQEALKKRIDQLRQSGQNAEADKLQEQLQKLQEQLPQMQQLQDMANKLGQCAKCLQDGQPGEAAQLLEQMAGDLKGLEQQLEEFKMIKEAMDELDKARQQMVCQKCGGAGCDECQPNGIPGMGMGKGRGMGERPEEETATNTYDTRTRPKVRPGAGIVVGQVEGPIVKGDVQKELLDQVQNAKTQAADPLTEQKMSRKHRQHAQEYFDRFRESK